LASIAPARAAAYAALLAVERGTAHSDDLLHSSAVAQLERRDRDLATELTLGTLRWELVLDEQIARRLRDSSAEMHLGVIVALRLGAYQLLMLDRVPPHAAIGEAVELAKSADGAGAGALVNAVLRRIQRETSGGKPHFAATDAHPAWMVRRWQQFYGPDAAARLCQADQVPAPSTLRLLSPDAEQELAARGSALAPGEFLTGAYTLRAGGDAAALCATGKVRAQDEASQLVGEIAALYASLAEDARDAPAVLDSCAAPGGKTAILLERTRTAHITALELSTRRLRALAARIAHPRLTLEPGDARALPPDGYDVILCDVPCSGTGTLARNPEIRTRLRESHFPAQAERQLAILDAALRALRPRGTLVYASCSLEPEENEEVVRAAMRGRDGYAYAPLSGALHQLYARGVLHAEGLARLEATALRDGFLRTLPGTHLCDGFFAAVVQRRP
jgi:16S rRNA (cytosine967-C5)-methyltransferase